MKRRRNAPSRIDLKAFLDASSPETKQIVLAEFAHPVQLRSLFRRLHLEVRLVEQIVFLGMLENKPIE
jgi:hypothetical protein